VWYNWKNVALPPDTTALPDATIHNLSELDGAIRALDERLAGAAV